MLGGFTGNANFDAAYVAHVDEVIDLQERVKSHYTVAAFLARYGRQNMLQWDDVEVNEVRRYALALTDLIREENELSRRAEDS